MSNLVTALSAALSLCLGRQSRQQVARKSNQTTATKNGWNRLRSRQYNAALRNVSAKDHWWNSGEQRLPALRGRLR
ncbi:MAG TPA: hypothetical protein V6D17_22710 [Candidatus Obscuribacterales bacterium]